MVENYYSAIDFVNWFAVISTPSWAILGLTSQSVFGRCCTTGHLGSTERSSSNNAGGWEGPSICCWWFLLGTKCLWSHVWRQREKPHKKVSCVLEVSLCLTASGIGFFLIWPTFEPASGLLNPWVTRMNIVPFCWGFCGFSIFKSIWALVFVWIIGG